MFKYVLVVALFACVYGESEDHHAEIEYLKSDVHHKGFDYEFETSNHIRQAAHGDEHGNIHGDFEWVDPHHGEHVAIKYVADKYGYQPEGKVLPTPHPIPDYILKAIEYIKAHPSAESEEYEHHEYHDDSEQYQH